ncbi:hypothetical protein DPMN_193441 [Dreissena polymorpha]|uniref:Uncharacterized protein n=1 Tax=Dreissena polymorpha TaxID=45954 RepID=A0A9D3Y1K6_DREPO|nr:hypothetical protein DPMN_193441 [Dreissena polymorpha]
MEGRLPLPFRISTLPFQCHSPHYVKLCLDIIKKNIIVKYHHYWTKTMASSRFGNFDKECLSNVNARVFTTKCGRTNGRRTKIDPKSSPEKSNELKCAKNVTSRVFTRKTAPPTGGHVFQRIGTTFEINQNIIKTNILTNFEHDRGFIGTNLLTEFDEDRTRNVASRVFTRKTDPPTCGHVFQRTGTTFELIQHFIKTNIFTKLHEDLT